MKWRVHLLYLIIAVNAVSVAYLAQRIAVYDAWVAAEACQLVGYTVHCVYSENWCTLTSLIGVFDKSSSLVSVLRNMYGDERFSVTQTLRLLITRFNQFKSSEIGAQRPCWYRQQLPHAAEASFIRPALEGDAFTLGILGAACALSALFIVLGCGILIYWHHRKEEEET